MPTGPEIILTLKVLVITVTLLFLISLVALARGHQRLHGQINTVFFILTMLTVFGFEVILQSVDVKASFNDAARQALRIHLCFSVPAALALPFMMFTGRTHRRSIHLALAVVFSLLWAGTFLTGVFFLPHE